MPLVVMDRGRVYFRKPKKPVKIGERLYDNELYTTHQREIALSKLSSDMYRLQTSLLKGKK